MPRSHSRKRKILRKKARSHFFRERRRRAGPEVSDAEILEGISGLVKAAAEKRMPTRKPRETGYKLKNVEARPGQDVRDMLKVMKRGKPKKWH